MNKIHPDLSKEHPLKILQNSWFRGAARQHCDDFTGVFSAFLKSLPDPDLPRHALKRSIAGKKESGEQDS